MIKARHQKIILSVIIAIMMFSAFSAVGVQAQNRDSYNVLVPLPGIGDNTGGATTLGDYLPAIFNLAIAVAAVMAFVMITWGGITYATSDALTGKAQGKEWITNAIWGLLLVIGAWVILYTINPKILKFNLILKTPSIQTQGSSATIGTPMTPAEQANDAEIRARLRKAGVTVNKPMCATQGQINCTNLNGMPESTVQSLETLAKDCKCSIEVTGGTESNSVHRTHGTGKTPVDINPNITSWLKTNNFVRVDGKAATVVLSSGRVVNLIYEPAGQGNSTGDHWHMF